MKITGTRSSIKFDLENGYIAKASGELLTNNRFVVYVDSFKTWEKPFDNQSISQREIEMIKKLAGEQENDSTMKLIFE